MSTKRLSKTVIEGGRYERNKFERRNSHVEVRAQERDYLKAVLADPEHAEEYEIDELQPVYQGFSDKLSPMYRWLDSQIGRPWSEVRSEVFQKFDTRTTAGRHITFDHLLREVVDTESGFDNHGLIIDPEIPKESGKLHRYWGLADYYVDQDGILRGKENRHRRYHDRYEKVTEEEYKAAGEWLNGRMIMEVGGKLHWLVPQEDIWMASWYEPYVRISGSSPYPDYYNYNRPQSLGYYVWRNGEYVTRTTYYSAWDNFRPSLQTSKNYGDHWEKVENPYSFRQRGELNSEEIKTFRNFKERLRDEILAFGKGR